MLNNSINCDLKIEEAKTIHAQYTNIKNGLAIKTGTTKSHHHPNLGVIAVSRGFLFSGYSLAEQILEALRMNHWYIAIVAMRSLYEMSVNANYIFNHPLEKHNVQRIRRLCRDIRRLANKKRKPNHTKLDGKRLFERAEEVRMKHSHRSIYRILSEWSHLSSRVLQIANSPKDREVLKVETAHICLCSLHNILNAMCSYYDYKIDKTLEEKVIKFY